MAEQVQGAQVVARIGSVLRIVGESTPDGITTAEVSRKAGLTRPTTHRLLSSLGAEGFVDHDLSDGRWYLGPELYLMGSLAAQRYDIADLARDSVRALAAATGESAFLSARRGDETVCLLREEGSFPLRSFVLHEGVRFPLGVASASLAILAFLSEAEAEAYLERRPLEEEWGSQHSAVAIRERLAETRELGYAVNPGLIIEGSWGMGAVVFDRDDRPAWALSITGVESRFRSERRPDLGRQLLKNAHEITQRLRSSLPRS